ncbi:Fungal transcriptional regulatory protein, N-terminal [Penicillium camemberti]|uniref:Fungal transcriptional regulatory protein, N-terminal n=1 Tax=Penicillium camemberti (strain FM 013) TaxID=1429867 RepID=A0A0G4P8K7_PENC3|nr:Fungal transcriptional regulatory protein, N-terminal [Penicillium camemberti]
MTSHALASCFFCRRSKRRCDKNLPTCQLCIKKGLKCSYPHRRGQRAASPPCGVHGSESGDDSNSAHAEPVVAQSSKVSQFQPISSTSSFAVNAAISFLAPDLFREAGLEIPRLDLGIPDEVSLHLGDSQQVLETARKFFQMTWMPIVSRKRHLAAVLNPLSPSRRPTVLLNLCMKLCYLPVNDDDGRKRTSLYRLIKKFYSEVESTGDLCVQVLQAAIFIAVFEIGDAIYPAAYLTVGGCARYGIAMGLDKINKTRLGGEHNRTASWMEIEEKRRVWWAILNLDRFLNFTNPARVLATEDPKFEDFLPVDDDKFYDANSEPEDAVPISQGFVFKIGHFGRLAQATYLISQALATIRSFSAVSTDLSNTSLSSETAQLCRTFEALARANEMEVTVRRLPFCCQSLISYSGVFLLQEHYWQLLNMRSRQKAQQHTYVETHNALDTLCRIAFGIQQGSYPMDLRQGQCTFLLVGVVYQGLSALLTIGKGNPSAEIRESITMLRWLLRHLRTRWPLSGKFLGKMS